MELVNFFLSKTQIGILHALDPAEQAAICLLVYK